MRKACGQKNVSEHFPLNSLSMVFITFRSLFVPGFLWLIWIKDCRLEIKTGCCNRKIEIWKLASEVQFIFSVNTEKRYQILSFLFLVGWKLKFKSSFSIFWKLKIKVRFWFFSLAEMFCFSILEQLHNKWNFFICRLWTTSLFRVLSLT